MRAKRAFRSFGGQLALSCGMRRDAGLPRGHRGRRRRGGRRLAGRGHFARLGERLVPLLLSDALWLKPDRSDTGTVGRARSESAGPFRFAASSDISMAQMNAHSGALRIWAMLSIGWIVGLNLLLAFVILRYRSVLWGWFDLSDAIDWPKLIGANLLPPLLLAVVMVPLRLARVRKPESS